MRTTFSTNTWGHNMALYSPKKPPLKPMSDINVTPMVDVMLVLLVIFIMAAPLLTHSINVDLPAEKAAAASAQDTPVVLSIDAQGQFFIDQNRVDEANLPDALTALARKNAQTPIHIRADQSIAYAKVAHLLAAAQSAGLSRVRFLTQAGGK